MKLILGIALLLPLCRMDAATPPTDLIYGHFELHVDYSPQPSNSDAGWRFSASYDEDDDFSTSHGVVRMDPESVVYLAAPSTRKVVPSPAGIFSRFGPPGTPVWILPQNNTLGSLYLGVRTTMAAGIFQASVAGNYSPSPQGSISLRLVSVTGTGPAAGGKFATWKTESKGSTIFSFDTTDGITAADAIETIPVSSHTHYNWGFTQPGTYQVTVEAKGKLMPPDNRITTAQKTFHFAVPFSSRTADGFSLRVVPELADAPRLLVADPAEAVVYAADRVMIESMTAAGTEASVLEGARWQVTGEVSTIAAAYANGAGVSPTIASGGLAAGEWAEVSLEILRAKGPGAFALIDNGAVVATTAGDSVALTAGASRPLLVAFTHKGLHRLTCVAKGRRHGDAVVSKPFTLTFGAGLRADYGYQDWRESFEVVPGSLADMQADPDGDGLSNGVEFAFAVHGLDPTVADGHLMPAAAPTAEGFGAIPFLRDTYKDPLDESSWQIRPAASADLRTWQIRSSRVPGFPLGIAETGAEEGNAHGRILRRQLRIMPAPRPHGFFRFSIIQP